MTGTKSGILSLPPEILLRGILFRAYPPDHYWRLSALALVCRYFNMLLTPHLYARVDVQMTGDKEPEDDDDDDEKVQGDPIVEEWGLKAKLMQTLSKSPALAAHVRKWYEDKDNRLEMEKDMGGLNPENIAVNLVNLEEGVFRHPYRMTDYVVSNIYHFKNLKRLKAVCPAELFDGWGKDNRKLPLEELKITTWYEKARSNKGKIMIVPGLINLFLMTCPALRSLEVELDIEEHYSYSWKIERKEKRPLGLLVARDDIPEDKPVEAPLLKHFGIQYVQLPDGNQNVSVEAIFGFVKELFDNNAGRLTSLSWRLNGDHFQNIPSTKDMIQSIKQDGKLFDGIIIPAVTGLKRLKLKDINWLENNNVAINRREGSHEGIPRVLYYLETSRSDLEELVLGEGYEFMKHVATAGDVNASPIGLDRLRKLKLKIELPSRYSRNNVDWEFENGGWLKSESFFPLVWKFILRLPRSLEYLQFDIAADDYSLDDDEFNVVSGWAVPLFLEFRSLSFFDFKLFTSDADGSACLFPENELVCVRRPRLNGKRGKVLIKRWLKNVYQHYEHRRILDESHILLTRTWDKVEEDKLKNDLEDGTTEQDLEEFFRSVKDDGRDVKEGEEEFGGKDGKDWWFPRVEYERMRFRCRADDCEELERKSLPKELQYPGGDDE